MAQHGSHVQGRGVGVDIHGRGRTVKAVAAEEGIEVSGIFTSSLQGKKMYVVSMPMSLLVAR